MQIVTGLLTVVVLSASLSLAAAADIKAGQKSYEDECKDCHDMKGAAVSNVNKKMLAQGVKMRDLASAEVQGKTDAEWKKMIMEGTGKMKPVKTLSPADVDNVVSFMRTLKKK